MNLINFIKKIILFEKKKIIFGPAAAILILTFLCVYVVSELCDMGHVEDVEIQEVIVHQLTEYRFSCKV
jgi:hypothetical protein